MDERTIANTPCTTESPVAEYEAPRVETVLTADDVERESLYGGISVG